MGTVPAWILALSVLLNAVAPLVAVWFCWGCLRTVKSAANEAAQRASDVQARWLSKELADSGQVELSGMSMAQAEEKSQPQPLYPVGAQRHLSDLHSMSMG